MVDGIDLKLVSVCAGRFTGTDVNVGDFSFARLLMDANDRGAVGGTGAGRSRQILLLDATAF